jgi:mannose-6-phosphate isomerase-like protein (cupin superfamily)
LSQAKNTSMSRLVVYAPDVESFSMPGDEDTYESQAVVCPDGVGSGDLEINRFTLKVGKRLAGHVHWDNDESYYVLAGHARLTLGGRPEDGEGGQDFEVGPESVAFIPAGTYHRLDNRGSEDLVLLTIWPRSPTPGNNPIWDARLEAWGTSFRIRDSDSIGDRA